MLGNEVLKSLVEAGMGIIWSNVVEYDWHGHSWLSGGDLWKGYGQ